MQPILKGMRIIEASAFIAAPMCGTTLAQLGAEVIRFDPILGGLDYSRWPITKNGDSRDVPLSPQALELLGGNE